MPLILLLQRKIGSVKTLELSFLIGGLSMIMAPLLPSPICLAAYGISGFAYGGLNMTVNLIVSDNADYYEVQSGLREEGTMFGVSAFFMVFSFLLTTIIPYVLEFTGFITAEANGGVDTVDQPLSAIWGMAGILIGNGAVLLIGYLAMRKYPLRGSVLEEMREKMLAIHAAKEIE
ncbi:MAG: hypothetical protein GY866_43235 [Proteobacteria bacterium]|nr:hypothetical protein [Pseudomonadota bacterium]